jgi:hypothetical protein
VQERNGESEGNWRGKAGLTMGKMRLETRAEGFGMTLEQRTEQTRGRQ